MGRFLIYFSYLGNRYRGLQSQGAFVKGMPVQTVQDALHAALWYLRPTNDYRITLSSRTDKGVHALKNACHVDLSYHTEGMEYNPDVITQIVNYHLKKSQHEIRVMETMQVPSAFHARKDASKRKYVYRLGHRVRKHWREKTGDVPIEVVEEEFLKELKKYSPTRKPKFRKALFGDDTTSLDSFRILMNKGELDISKLMSAAEVISGVHNFTAFTAKSHLVDPKTGVHLAHPVKLVTIGIKRGQPLGARLHRGVASCLEDYELWDIHVEASSFLYRMVRRIIGAMLLHARGKISLSELQDILDNPRHEFPFSNIMGVSEAGLFLQEVIYSPKVLKMPDNSDTERPDSDSISEAREGCVQVQNHTVLQDVKQDSCISQWNPSHKPTMEDKEVTDSSSSS